MAESNYLDNAVPRADFDGTAFIGAADIYQPAEVGQDVEVEQSAEIIEMHQDEQQGHGGKGETGHAGQPDTSIVMGGTDSDNGTSQSRYPAFHSKTLPPELGSVRITITTQRSRKDTYARGVTMTVQEFVDRLSTPAVGRETHKEYLALGKEAQTDAKDVGAFVLGTLKGSRRKKGAVDHLCGVALDADNADVGLIDIIRFTMPYLVIVYSTRRHTPAKPRYRIIILFSHVVPPEQHSAVARKLAEHIGIETFDKSTFETNRCMFFPSISCDDEYVFDVFGNDLCDPDKILAEYDDWRDSSQWPMCPDEKTLIGGGHDVTKNLDPLSKPGSLVPTTGPIPSRAFLKSRELTATNRQLSLEDGA